MVQRVLFDVLCLGNMSTVETLLVAIIGRVRWLLLKTLIRERLEAKNAVTDHNALRLRAQRYATQLTLAMRLGASLAGGRGTLLASRLASLARSVLLMVTLGRRRYGAATLRYAAPRSVALGLILATFGALEP